MVEASCSGKPRPWRWGKSWEGRCAHAGKGLSLIEVVVVLAILGMMIGLILPAVQSVREQSHRLSCQSHLKNLGLAVMQYEGSHRSLPPGASSVGSYLVVLLPYLEHDALYQMRITKLNSVSSTPSSLPGDEVALKVLLCPSDPAPRRIGQWAGGNYAGCGGRGVLKNGFDGVFRYVSIDFERFGVGVTRAADILDGMAYTCMASEIRRATGETGRLVTYWNTPRMFTAAEEEDFLRMCDGIPSNPPASGWRGDPWARGLPWTNGSMGYMLYNHAVAPNRPSCMNGGTVVSGIATAGSYHRGGVNVLFCDGHLEFVADGVDLNVWRRIASRSAND